MPTRSDPSHSIFIHTHSTSSARQRPQHLSVQALTSQFSGYTGGVGRYSPFTTHYSLSSLETPTPNGASLYMYVQERPGGPGTQVLDMRRFLIAIVSLAVLPAIASAQRGGMGAGMAHPAMAAPAAHVAMHSSAAAGAHVTSQVNSGPHYVSSMRYVRTLSGAIVARPIPHSTAPVQRAGSGRQLLSQDLVPGLGFDYVHVAAVHPNGFNNRFRNRQFVGTYIPFFYGGGYY